jgi:hypothetical protein
MLPKPAAASEVVWDETILAALFKAHDDTLKQRGRVDWKTVAERVGRGVTAVACWLVLIPSSFASSLIAFSSLHYYTTRIDNDVDELNRTSQRDGGFAATRRHHFLSSTRQRWFSDSSVDEGDTRDSTEYWCHTGLRPRSRDEMKQDGEESVRKIIQQTVTDATEEIAKETAQKYATQVAIGVARQIAADSAAQIAQGVAQRVASEIAKQTAYDVAKQMVTEISRTNNLAISAETIRICKVVASVTADRKAREVASIITKDMAKEAAKTISQEMTKKWEKYTDDSTDYAVGLERERRRRRRRGSRYD